jgi:outer membrane receptor protein involved in Fe transport
MKFLFTILISLFALPIFAQNFTIKGIIIDSVSQKTISTATIFLKQKNNKVIQSTLSDQNGNFLLETISTEPVFLEISSVGYQTLLFPVSFSKQLFDAGIIGMKPTIVSLSDVIIEGKKAPVNFKLDRQVFNASQFSNATNGTATDLLKNLPSVSVNGLGEISLRGSTSFLVLINGKPTQGDVIFILGQLPAASIENIEIISSPGAAFDADGKAGIINIVTKSNIQDGWMIQTSAMTGTPPLNDYNNDRNPTRYNIDVNAGYKKNKLEFNVGFNLLRNDISGYREGDVYTITNNIKTSFPSNGERSLKKYNYGIRLGINYQINTSTSISSGFYSGKKYQSRIANLQYQLTRENLTTQEQNSLSYWNENDQQKQGKFTLANVDLNKLLSKDAKINFSILYEAANLYGNTSNNNLKSKYSNDTLQYTINPYSNPLNAVRLKTDFSKKLGNANIQIGYQFRYDTQNGNFNYKTNILGTNEFQIDSLFSSGVKAINQIHAGYVQYFGAVKKINYNAGIRMELTNRNLYFSTLNKTTQIQLINLFPSIQLRYKALEKTTFKIGYNRRIKRTNNYELNPFPEREHSETLEQGDPNLLPELISNCEFGVEKTIKRGNFFATIYYQTTRNPIQRVNKIFNDSILVRAFTNAGKATQYGFEANLNLKINNIWSFILGGNIYQYQINGNIFNNSISIKNSSLVYSINSTQNFNLPKFWSVQLSVNYLSNRATAQGNDSRFLTPHLSIKKSTADKRWSFQLQWLNIDAGMKQSNRQRITTSGKDFYTTTNYIYETDQIQFSTSFNLSKRNRKIVLPTSEIGEKEF